MAELHEHKAEVIAASVDPREDAQELMEMLDLAFPIAYGLDFMEFAKKTGAFYEVRRSIIHATGFILQRDGTVTHSVFASGPIGRLWPGDCLRVIG